MAHLSFCSNLFIYFVIGFSTYKLAVETTWSIGLFYLSSVLLIILCVERELSVKREDELKRLLKKNNIDFYDEDEENINALEEAATQLKNLRKTFKKNKEADKVKDDKDEVTSVSEETKQSE